MDRKNNRQKPTYKALEFEVACRKPIQISTSVYQGCLVVALCDDGTIWRNENNGKWQKMDDIPKFIEEEVE